MIDTNFSKSPKCGSIMAIATTIGSLPHKDTEKAIDLIFRYTSQLPAWPQLPKRSFFENMVVQYSENFPGVVVEEKEQKIYIDCEKSIAEMETFYENYLIANLAYFSISEKYASGFYTFFNRLISNYKHPPITAVKCHTVGPITYGMMLKDKNDRSIFSDEQLRDAVIKHIAMKSLWQIKELFTIQHLISNIVVFLDEPYLSTYGSAFTALNRQETTKTISEVITEIKSLTSKLLPEIKLEIGIHCCGNTDWSLLLDSEVDIISFDAYGYFDNLLLYSEKLVSFFARGGKLAWGVVPTNPESVEKESADNLVRLINYQLNLLKSKVSNSELARNQIILTPSCGMGSLSEELAEKVLIMTKEVSEAL